MKQKGNDVKILYPPEYLFNELVFPNVEVKQEMFPCNIWALDAFLVIFGMA